MLPDAPWVGKCREDYYGYDEGCTVYCECCGAEIYEDDVFDVDGVALCKDCYSEEEEVDEDYD